MIKVITQQPSKRKTYTESKVADRSLELEIIKINILPKNNHKVIKLKSLNLKSMISKLTLQHPILKKVCNK